ncbi:MAG: DUF4255 domain-containing protein [Myxococcales bacterium]|nr:DUF4255 domain-containing protein [Myxococcales bacterium]
MSVMVGQHHIIKETSETIGQLLQGTFREAGYKRVHLVVAAPKQEAIEGKLPAVSVYLYNLTLDEEGISANRNQRIEQEIQPDGSVKEVARDQPLWLRLDYLISTWAQTPEEEQLLMGVAIRGIIEHPTLRGAELKGDSMASVDYIPLLLSQRLDEGVLSRFWASLNQPLKPGIQCWTTVPLFPSGSSPVTRVVDPPEVRFFDLNKLNRVGG